MAETVDNDDRVASSAFTRNAIDADGSLVMSTSTEEYIVLPGIYLRE